MKTARKLSAAAVGIFIWMLSLFMPFLVFGAESGASAGTVTAQIPVSCVGTNTSETFQYVLSAEDTSDQTIESDILSLKDGEEGTFYVKFTYPGTYHYTVTQSKGTDNRTTYDDTVYEVDVYVTENEDGTMFAEPVAYVKGSTGKKAKLDFVNTREAERTVTRTPDSVKTDDMTNAGLFAGVCGFSAAMLIILIMINKGKRKKNKQMLALLLAFIMAAGSLQPFMTAASELDTDVVEEALPGNVLEYENTEQAPYLSVTLTGKQDFPAQSYGRIAILEGAELDSTIQSLDAFLGNRTAAARLPLKISILDENGGERAQLGEVSVKVRISDAGSLGGTELYHQKGDGTWECLNYQIYEENGIYYAEFKTESFSPFLFVTTEEIPDPAADNPDDSETPGGTGDPNTPDETGDTDESDGERAPNTPDEAGDTDEPDDEEDPNTPDEAGDTDESDDEKNPNTPDEAGDTDESDDEEDADTPDETDDTDESGLTPLENTDVEPVFIDKFDVSFASGAVKTDGKWVWNPTDPASGHQFIYRADYTMSGTFSMEKGAFRIELPLHILKDRDGNWADEFECPYILESEVSEGEEPDFVYTIDEENNKVYIYNYAPYPTGEAGYIEFAYVTEKSTLYYEDMVESTEVEAKVYATNENSTVTAEAKADPVVIDTHATINYTQKKVPDYYSTWQDSWGTAPEDADSSVYLVWTIRTNINKITSPYNFTITDTFTDLEGSVVGYRMAGRSGFSDVNHAENLTGYGDRYDYVLTRHSKEEAQKLVEEAGRYEVTNKVTATVDPIDQVDEDTTAEASRSWWYETPRYAAPTGHFRADKWGIYGKYNRVYDSEDISDYTLDEFQEGEEESIDNLRYYTYGEGYAWPWTLSDDADGTIDDVLNNRYGQKKVTYELTDDTLYLEGSDTALNDEDYDITALEWTATMRTATFNDTSLSFTETGIPEYSEEDAVTIEVRTGTEWVQAAVYDMRTGTYSEVNSDYVTSVSGSVIHFADGVKGFQFTCENAYYHTKIEAYPTVSLKRTDHVLSMIGKETEKVKVRLTNQSSFRVTQYDEDAQTDNLLYSKTMRGTDYIQKVARESEIKKDVIQTRNDKTKRQFVVTWRVTAQEKYTDNSGVHSIYQESGTFYDLAPSGAVIDKSSVAVFASGQELAAGTYEVRTIENYRDSGRTLLIIQINEPTSTTYRFSYNSIHSYNSIYDYGKNLLNSAAYETGNNKIAEGYPDNGGKITDKNILADLDASTDAEKFLYAEARYDINILMAANTGLMKQVKNEDDMAYSYNTTIYNGGAYSYRVRLANDSSTRAKNIILFDSLENFYQEADETGQTIPSDWKGTLTGIDISALTAKDIDAVVYLSRIDNMNIHGHHDLDEVLDGERVWIEYNEFKQLYGLDAAHAIAVDARKTTSHEDFVLATKESISFTVYMQAPERDTTGKTDPVTYNNIYVERTALKNSGDEITEIDQFFHQDYTQIHYRIIGNLYLKKVDETDMSSPVSGAAYLLRGTSDYGTEYELTRVSDRSGAISFTNLEKGTYELVETDCGNAWQINTEVYTVVIDEQGNTVINLPEKDGVYLVADTPRIYADISFMKQDSISGSPLNEVQFMLSGTSDYGNDVLLYAVSGSSTPGKVSFSDVEKGTYTLVETKASDGYIDQGTVWTVKVTGQGMFSIFNGDQQLDLSSSGNYEIKNEPYHEIRFLKSSTYGTNIYLEGAEFSLTGVSDYGTSTDMTAESDSNGLVVFSGLEPGTYLLKETKAPADHDLNETTYTVIVSSDGSFEIDGLGTTEFNGAEVYDFKDTKTSGMVCLIKRWEDDKTNDERVIPDMTITTQKPSADPKGYTVTFDANGGTYGNNTTANKVIYNQSNAIVDGTYMEPTMNSEYVSFAGWYTKTSSGTKVEISADGIPANALNGDITLYAQWNSPPRYAVAIYGIGVDTDKSGNTMGLTFGPALGASYVNSYKSHTPTGTTASGNSHRCVHDDNWETIISWNKEDPYVYEQCIAEGCTHSVILTQNTSTSVLSTTQVNYTGDGPSVLYNEVSDSVWHSSTGNKYGRVVDGWAASRVRAILNGKDSYTDTTYDTKAKNYTSSNCLLKTFPTELQNAIGYRAVKFWGGEETYDKLWLLSARELGSTNSLYTSEGSLYPKFSGASDGIVGYRYSQFATLKSSTQEFWTRTVGDFNQPRAIMVNKTGNMERQAAGSAFCGIAPGFSLSR